jgi:hypothetical protein
MSAAAPVKLPFCSQLEERLLLWLEYHPLIASYARGDIGPQFAATYRLPIRHPAPFTIGYLFEGKPHTMETSGAALQVAPSRSTAQCSFSRVTVPIDLQVWAKSGPRAAECPDCGATRALEHHRGGLRFAPHNRVKRKTKAQLAALGWARRNMTWQVVGGDIGKE